MKTRPRDKKKIEATIAKLTKALPAIKKLEQAVYALYTEAEIEESDECGEGAPTEASAISASVEQTIAELKGNIKCKSWNNLVEVDGEWENKHLA